MLHHIKVKPSPGFPKIILILCNIKMFHHTVFPTGVQPGKRSKNTLLVCVCVSKGKNSFKKWGKTFDVISTHTDRDHTPYLSVKRS